MQKLKLISSISIHRLWVLLLLVCLWKCGTLPPSNPNVRPKIQTLDSLDREPVPTQKPLQDSSNHRTSRKDTTRKPLSTTAAPTPPVDTLSVQGISDSLNAISKDSLVETPPIDSLVTDSLINDSLKTNQLKKKKKSTPLKGILKYKATDSIVKNFKTKKLTLHKGAKLEYLKSDLKSGTIEINLNTKNVRARGIYDTTAKKTKEKPIFKDNGEVYNSDTLIYNYQSEKGFLYNVRTQNSDGIILGEKIKKEDENTVYISEGKYTTDKSKHPDYYIKSSKIRFNNTGNIITNWSQMWIADVPTPFFLPFSFFPSSSKRKSGFIMPTWGESRNEGFFLLNGGLYLSISQYLDFKLLGDIYSSGNWGFRTTSSYRKKYRYNGNFAFNYNTSGSSAFSGDFGKSVNYNLNWSHSQDPKANPTLRFSANVNLGSSNYYKRSLNEYNTNAFLNNTISSSISLDKSWEDSPWRLSTSARHSQNTNTKKIDISLPIITVSMNRIFPFETKGQPKKTWWENLSVSYTGSAQNNISTTDSTIFTKKMVSEMKNGIQHSIPISTNTKLFQYLSLSTSLNYTERWYFSTIRKRQTENSVIAIDTLYEFDSNREFSLSSGLSTTLYGIWKFSKDSKLQAIRHLMRPSISYSFKPDFGTDFWGYYNKIPGTDIEYSRFELGAYGYPGKGRSSSINFSMSNNLEAKIKSLSDTTETVKKIKIIDNLSISSSYNFAADNFKMSNVNISGNNTFFSKYNINYSATIDPYLLDGDGRRIDQFAFKNGAGLGRITSGYVSLSFGLNNKDFEFSEDKTIDTKRQKEKVDLKDFFKKDDKETLSKPKKQPKTRYKPYTIPWNLSINYGLNYSKPGKDPSKIAQTLSFNGSISPSKKWRVNFSSGYDFENNGFSHTNFGISRDLGSFTMRFDWVPFGRTSYYFFIGIKASVLSDLKYEERSTPTPNIFSQQ